MLQIGTRNMQNFALLQAVGGVRKPVMLKRGLTATYEEWLMAAEYVAQRGNLDIVLCERGIRTFETATRNTLDVSAVPMVHALSHLPVVVDPSHSAGKRDLVVPLTRAAIAVGADAVMVDVHADPTAALCDGPQALYGDAARRAGRRLPRPARRCSAGRVRRLAGTPPRAAKEGSMRLRPLLPLAAAAVLLAPLAPTAGPRPAAVAFPEEAGKQGAPAQGTGVDLTPVSNWSYKGGTDLEFVTIKKRDYAVAPSETSSGGIGALRIFDLTANPAKPPLVGFLPCDVTPERRAGLAAPPSSWASTAAPQATRAASTRLGVEPALGVLAIDITNPRKPRGVGFMPIQLRRPQHDAAPERQVPLRQRLRADPEARRAGRPAARPHQRRRRAQPQGDEGGLHPPAADRPVEPRHRLQQQGRPGLQRRAHRRR